jgi:hypothetical protein
MKYAENQKDGFPADAHSGVDKKTVNGQAMSKPFGVDDKPSGFRGKSAPYDMGSDNTEVTPTGPNTGGGNR